MSPLSRESNRAYASSTACALFLLLSPAAGAGSVHVNAVLVNVPAIQVKPVEAGLEVGAFSATGFAGAASVLASVARGIVVSPVAVAAVTGSGLAFGLAFVATEVYAAAPSPSNPDAGNNNTGGTLLDGGLPGGGNAPDKPVQGGTDASAKDAGADAGK
jgi:hypothetical protein